MGWAVGEWRGRHIGYGVPATCDYPGCGERIDRGMSYACGGGITSDTDNCGLFFCFNHLVLNPRNYVVVTEDGESWEEDSGKNLDDVCASCASYDPETYTFKIHPFEPTPDLDEWVQHVLTDESWAQFRAENPDWGKK